MSKLTVNQLEDMINKCWGRHYAIFYFAQVLNGECSVKETLEDLLSLWKEEKKND